MKILLLNQYFTCERKSPERIKATLPINLLCLASYLKSRGVKCKIYELGIFNFKKIIFEKDRIRYGVSDEKIVNILKTERPKIVGLGCMYSRHYIDIINISRLIKKVDSSIKVVVGGNHSTSFHNMVIKESSIDFVVRGEGEITFYELCQEILNGSNNLKKVKGITYKDKNGKIIINQNRELIKNLDTLPPLDYSLVNMSKYINISYDSPYFMRYPGIGIISSRGCPGNCVYCTVRAVWGKTWRAKSAEKTVDEIEFLHKKYGVNEFAFLDDTASLDKKRWNNICKEIVKRNLDIRWSTPNGIAHWTLNKKILKNMKKAGCYRVTFGIESGNAETRKFLGKPFSLEQAREIINYANKIGMWTICTNIIGFPYETRESINDTIEFAKKSGTDFATFYLLAPIVTSDVYQFFKKEGLLNFDSIFENNVFNLKEYEKMNKILNDGGVPTKYFTYKELKKIQIRAYRSFIIYRAITFLNPLRILRKIRSLEDFKYTMKLFITGGTLIVKSFYKKTTKALLYE